MGMITAHARTLTNMTTSEINRRVSEITVFDLSSEYNKFVTVADHYGMDMPGTTSYRVFQVITEIILCSKKQMSPYTGAMDIDGTRMADVIAGRVVEELSYALHSRYFSKELGLFDVEELVDMMGQVNVVDSIMSVMLDRDHDYAILEWFHVGSHVELHLGRLEEATAPVIDDAVTTDSMGRVLRGHTGLTRTFDPIG